MGRVLSCVNTMDAVEYHRMAKKELRFNEDVLKAQGIGLVIVFGSKVAGISHGKSDIDIGVVFLDGKKRTEKPVEVYGSLHEEFSKKFKNENIDVVYLQEAPLSLQYKAIKEGVVLYQKSPTILADYKEGVLKKYFDFKFFEDIFHKAIIHAV